MDVVIELEPLSEQSGLVKFLRNEDHAGMLNGLVQDIANAVTDYQVCGGNVRFTAINNRLDLPSTKHIREYQRHPRKSHEYRPDHQKHR